MKTGTGTASDTPPRVRDTDMGHRGCEGMELLCPTRRDGQMDGGMHYSQTSHLMAF